MCLLISAMPERALTRRTDRVTNLAAARRQAGPHDAEAGVSWPVPVISRLPEAPPPMQSGCRDAAGSVATLFSAQQCFASTRISDCGHVLPLRMISTLRRRREGAQATGPRQRAFRQRVGFHQRADLGAGLILIKAWRPLSLSFRCCAARTVRSHSMVPFQPAESHTVEIVQTDLRLGENLRSQPPRPATG